MGFFVTEPTKRELRERIEWLEEMVEWLQERLEAIDDKPSFVYSKAIEPPPPVGGKFDAMDEWRGQVADYGWYDETTGWGYGTYL